ncbi:MAG: DUF7059 domain-containing protein [Nocardioides sp.]
MRDALLAAGFTHDAVNGLLGPAAHQALVRNGTSASRSAPPGRRYG